MDGIVSLLTTTEGRIGRQRWWIGVLVLLVISIVLAIVIGIVTGGNPVAAAWGSFIVTLVLLWPSYCIGVKRRHDRDNDGRDLIVLIVGSVILNLLQVLGIGVTLSEVNGVPVLLPDMWLVVLQVIFLIFAIYMLVQVGFLKGTPGPNKYGPDPLAT